MFAATYSLPRDNRTLRSPTKDDGTGSAFGTTGVGAIVRTRVHAGEVSYPARPQGMGPGLYYNQRLYRSAPQKPTDEALRGHIRGSTTRLDTLPC